MVNDLYQAWQQVVWYEMGEAMLKGQVPEVQKLVIEFKDIEEDRRTGETETLGVGDEINFDVEMQIAQEINRELALLATEMLNVARNDIQKVIQANDAFKKKTT